MAPLGLHGSGSCQKQFTRCFATTVRAVITIAAAILLLPCSINLVCYPAQSSSRHKECPDEYNADFYDQGCFVVSRYLIDVLAGAAECD